MAGPANWRDVTDRARALDPTWNDDDRAARRRRMRADMLAAVSSTSPEPGPAVSRK